MVTVQQLQTTLYEAIKHDNDGTDSFDEELTFKKLPASWKEGDTWKLITGANGQVTLIRESKATN